MRIHSIMIFSLAAITISACTANSSAQKIESNQMQSFTTPSTSPTATEISLPQSSPTPFQKMTIPFLRTQKFQSSISPLQQISENTTHTSYLTSYQSEEFKVNALITQPKGTKPARGWPAIVFVHGYIPPSLYKTTERYVDHVNFLARNGYVVFKIDLRGHGNSEGEPGGGYYSSDYVIDTLSAIRALQSTDFVDDQNIGLWGHSMAGNVLLRTFAAAPETPAVVIWGGAGFTYDDLREFRIQDNSYRPPASNAPSQQTRRELFATHGNYDPQSDFWKQVTPANYLSDLKGAIQLHHAINDDVVNIAYSRNLNKLLNQTSVTHELNEYPSGGHNISGTSFTQAMQKTVNFYNTHLKNTE